MGGCEENRNCGIFREIKVNRTHTPQTMNSLNMVVVYIRGNMDMIRWLRCFIV